MTGMLGVGIGEVVIPQLVKKNGVPVPVAAGTSVLVVCLNAVGEMFPSGLDACGSGSGRWRRLCLLCRLGRVVLAV